MPQPSNRPRFYPIYVNLEGQSAVVVGGGKVAERKIKTLIAHGADVMVVAPELTEQIEDWVREQKCDHLGRGYVRGDLQGAFVVVCATDSEEVNRAVYDEALTNRQLVNVVDVPELCNFIVPSIVRRGDLQIAISTAGAAPAVAKRIRKQLETEFGDEWAQYVALLGDLRAVAMQQIPEEAERKRLFEAAADSDLFERVRAGKAPNAQELYIEISRKLSGES